VLAILRAGRVFVSWAGDSMAYRVSHDAVEPLTWRHDFFTWHCRERGLSEEERRHLWGRNVLLHYLGWGLPDPIEVLSFVPRPGDRLVLATDGVHGLFEPAEFATACQQHPDTLACAEHLVREALSRNSRDNATCVVIAFDGPPGQEPDPPGRKPESRTRGPWWRFWARG
jgi:protein phosphatase